MCQLILGKIRNKKTMIKRILTILIVTLFLSSASYAEGERLRSKLSKGSLDIYANIKKCDADAKKFCPGLKTNAHKQHMCMMAYEDKLSDECKLGILETAIAIKMSAAAIDYSVDVCEADADKYCLNVKPGEGRLVGCIKKHESKVSMACKSVLKETGLWWSVGTK